MDECLFHIIINTFYFKDKLLIFIPRYFETNYEKWPKDIFTQKEERRHTEMVEGPLPAHSLSDAAETTLTNGHIIQNSNRYATITENWRIMCSDLGKV